MEDRNVILVGEGTHRHVLYGDADFNEGGRLRGFDLLKDGFLRHEDLDGEAAEHRTLAVEAGCWAMGMQMEYNPFAFEGQVRLTPVWD